MDMIASMIARMSYASMMEQGHLGLWNVLTTVGTVAAPYAQFGFALFGWWFGIVAAVPFGCLTIWRVVRGRSWALFLAATMVLAAFFFMWLLPVEMYRWEFLHDDGGLQRDVALKCRPPIYSVQFTTFCEGHKKRFKLTPYQYGVSMVCERYATWFSTYQGMFSVLAIFVAIVVAVGLLGLFANYTYERRERQRLEHMRGHDNVHMQRMMKKVT